MSLSEAKSFYGAEAPAVGSFPLLGADHYRVISVFPYRILLQSGRGVSLQSGRSCPCKVAVDNLLNPHGFQQAPAKWPWF